SDRGGGTVGGSREAGAWEPAGDASDQRVRTDGRDDVHVLPRDRGSGHGAGIDPDREADCEHGRVRPGRGDGARAGGGGGGAVRRGGRTGAWGSEPCGCDGGAVRAEPVREGGWGAVVPDGRSGAVAVGRDARVPGTSGRPGEGAGVPDRARGDRRGASVPPGRAGGGDARARRERWREAARVVCGAGREGRGARRGGTGDAGAGGGG